MSTTGTFIIHTDGGARGNPGPAGYAVVIQRHGDSDVEEKGFLGKTTNNVAEYSALVRALELAHELDGKRLTIHSDSELMVQQMNGVYKVKNEGLIPLFRKARDLVKEFEQVTIRHVRREQNSRADALANEAMDDPHGHAEPQRTATKSAKPPAPTVEKPDAALMYLAGCAVEWSRGNPQDPDPAVVLEKLRGLMK